MSVCLLILITGADSLAGPEQTAQGILKATGVKGGLIVHLGCGEGKLTGALRADDSYLVHGLDCDPADVEAARKYLNSKNVYGKVSVDVFDGENLPYTEDLVNLIVAEDIGEVSTDELMRVLAPNGVAYVKKGDKWEKTVKPWPDNIDEWTHYLHDPTNNAVSRDKAVGPPRHLRWAGLPEFARAHEQLASISAIVTSRGRLFYIIDEGPRADIRLPSQWRLVARDAFNGVVLWKRPIESWADHLRSFRSGPPDLAFRLVAADEKVYVTEAIDAALSVLDAAWQAKIGGRLSGVTVAGGRAFVASVDRHTIYALDSRDGKMLWTYTAGGRIDSPPTINKGLVLFGSADGWVYALLASDGRLAWRFRAAPEDRRTFVNGQLESVWPVHGSVLVKDDCVIVAAGRSSYLDGGIHIYRLEPAMGREISHTCVYSPVDGKQPPEGGKELRGVLSDVLSAIGNDVYMRHMKVDFADATDTQTGVHLFTPTGFLDDTWWHRAYWVINDEFLSHWSAWWKVGNLAPSGRILSYDQSSVFGYGRDRYVGGNTGQWRGGEKYQLFAHDRNTARQAKPPEPPKDKRAPAPAPAPLEYRWTKQVPLFVTAMLVAEDNMFIAGPPDIVKAQAEQEDRALVLENPQEALEIWTGEKGGALLWAVSTQDGTRLAQYRLDSQPVFDGMAAANGRLYIAQKDGRLLCLAAR